MGANKRWRFGITVRIAFAPKKTDDEHRKRLGLANGRWPTPTNVPDASFDFKPILVISSPMHDILEFTPIARSAAEHAG